MLTKFLESAATFMAGRGTAIILFAAILLGSTLGLMAPQVQNVLSDQIDLTILLLVFLLLFEVRVQSIISSINRFGFVVAALVLNFLVIPVLGFVIASTFLSAHPLFLLGLVIYFMAPCTDWFLAFTRLANGNTALGAALLPINMIVQLLLYPIYLHIFGIDAVGENAASLFQTLWQWFLIPLLMAVGLRLLAERVLSVRQLDLVQSLISVVVPVLLAVLVGQISAVNIGTLVTHASVIPLILCAILVFFIATYFLSEMVSRAMRLDHADQVLMTMTTAARNAPLMLALTMAVLPDQPIVYAAIIIGMLIELPHLVGLKMVLKRQKRSGEPGVTPLHKDPALG